MDKARCTSQPLSLVRKVPTRITNSGNVLDHPVTILTHVVGFTRVVLFVYNIRPLENRFILSDIYQHFRSNAQSY